MDVAPKFGFLSEDIEKGLWLTVGIGVTFLGGGIAGGAILAFGGMEYIARRWDEVRDNDRKKCMDAFLGMVSLAALSFMVVYHCNTKGLEACRLDENSAGCYWYGIAEKTCLVAAGVFGFGMVCLGIERMQMKTE